jgi:hypothetical protein
MIHQAIYNLYPNVTGISGFENPSAYDSNGGLVVIDMNAVTQEVESIEAEAQAQAEAKETLRQSMISKLATTLTPEETALLEELL